MTSAILQHRRDTAANWTSNNPVLAAGQMGYETDTLKHKFGDGTTAWNSLSYAGAGTALLAANNLSDLASASTARTNLGLGSLATQSGTFSGTSSGTNTGDQTITLTGDVTGSGTGSFSATIATGAVSTTKLGGDITTAGKALLDDANAAAQRTTLGLAAVAASGSAADLSAGTLPAARMPALTGDVTTTAGTVATTIANGAVTNAKLRNSAALSVIGRAASTTGAPADITASTNGVLMEQSGALLFQTIGDANITADSIGVDKIAFNGNPDRVAGTDGSGTPTILRIGAGFDLAAGTHTHDAADVVSGTLNRARLGSGTTGGTTKFLREDSTWAVPSGATTTVVNVNLGAGPRYAGSFTLTIPSSTVGSLVEIFESAETIVATGELADRLECDQVHASGRVTASTTATVWWRSFPGPVGGTRRFAYRITPI